MLNSNNIKQVLYVFSRIMQENRGFLIEIDSVFGDGDLGITMSEGFAAAYQSITDKDETDIGKLFYFAGKAMSSKAPSTMGTLMATGLMSAGKALKEVTEIDLGGITLFAQSYLDGVMKLGKAKAGEKTFIDGFFPAVESLKQSVAKDADIKNALSDAAQAAKEGYENTKNMLAVHGRAAIRGEQSRTVSDPGAAVAMLLFKAFSEYINTL